MPREVKDLGHCTPLFLCNDALFPFSRFLLVLLGRDEKRAIHMIIGIEIALSRANERDRVAGNMAGCRRMRIRSVRESENMGNPILGTDLKIIS